MDNFKDKPEAEIKEAIQAEKFKVI